MPAVSISVLQHLKLRLAAVPAALVCVLVVGGGAAAQAPGAPSIASVTAGGRSLAVVWTAPGGATVTSYDLRYIETAEDESVDGNWTVESAVWSSGALEYTVTGLDAGVSYDVQVRAVNGSTQGAWSATSMGTPLIAAPTVTAGEGSLAVVWAAPGGATVRSYDLRHIETSEDGSVESNWSVETGVWSSGALEYTVTGLDGGVSYDVEVRAVIGGSAGAWSATSMGTPLVGAPTIDSVVVGEGALTVSWGEPAHGARAPIASFDLRYIETSADETVDANWTVETSVWTGGPLHYVLDDLTNGTGYDVQVRAVVSGPAGWSATSVGTPAEHGATLADATDVAAGVPAVGSIDPGTDVDYFKVVLTEATGVLVSTQGTLDTVGELQESDGTLIRESDDGFGTPGIRNFLIWDSLPAGTYYVKVTSYDGATGDYVLSTMTVADSGVAFEDRHPISLGEHRYGLIDPSGDTDWYTFALAEETRVVVRGSSRIDGELRDSSVHSFGGVLEFDLPSSGFVHMATLAAGKYYIHIEGSVGLHSLYLLEAPEPGSTRAGAVPLDFYRPAGGAIDPTGDVDYFSIELDEDTHLRLWAVGDDVDIEGELQDSAGNAVSGVEVVRGAVRLPRSGRFRHPRGTVGGNLLPRGHPPRLEQQPGNRVIRGVAVR